MDKRYTKLAKNTGVMLAGNLSSKLISFLLLPVYTHYLSTSAYGESDMINVYASILLSLITCCVADGMFVFPKKEDDEGKQRYFTSGLAFVLGSFTIVALLLLLLDILFKPQQGVILLDKWWIYLMSFSMFIQLYFQQFALSLEKTTLYSISGVVLTVLMAVLAIILLPINGLSGYLLSIVLANIGSALFLLVSCRFHRYVSIHSIDIEYLKRLLKYGIPLIPNSVMWWLMNGLNRPLMEVQLGLSAIGIYSVAYKFPTVLSMVFQVISHSMSITVVDEFGKADFNAFYNRILRILTMSVLFVGAILCVCSKWLIDVFADADFYPAWQYMPLLTLAVIFQCMGSFIGNIFMAEKKSKYFFYSSLWGAGTSIAFTLLFIRLWGLLGVCIAMGCSFLVMFVIRVYYAWENIDLFSIKYYLFSFAAYISLVVMSTMDLSYIWLLTGLFMYFIVAFLINRDEVLSLVNAFLKTKVNRNIDNNN